MTSNKEINKFITEEIFGECWHEADIDHRGLEGCKHCNIRSYSNWNKDFFTWEGFGKLWVYSQEQTWWVSLHGSDTIKESIINPERFVTLVYNFFKGK